MTFIKFFILNILPGSLTVFWKLLTYFQSIQKVHYFQKIYHYKFFLYFFLFSRNYQQILCSRLLFLQNWLFQILFLDPFLPFKNYYYDHFNFTFGFLSIFLLIINSYFLPTFIVFIELIIIIFFQIFCPDSWNPFVFFLGIITNFMSEWIVFPKFSV